MTWRWVTLALVMTLATGCAQREEPPAALRLDGSARIPDDEGIATAVDRRRITLDGERTYAVGEEFRSFSTYTRELEPMVGRRGQYVQLGLRDDEVVWMAGVARVVVVDGEEAVFYTGRFREVGEDGRFVFTDGTTFAVERGVSPPGNERPVTARIDPRRHRIVEIE